MSTLATQFVTIVALLLVLLIKIDGDSISPILNDEVNKNSTTKIVVVEVGVDQIDPVDCTNRPEICSNGEFPPRSVMLTWYMYFYATGTEATDTGADG
ncbi:STIG1-like protein, partial [Trifolium pratense]